MTTLDNRSTADALDPLFSELAQALRRVEHGDFKARLRRRTGLAGEVADAFNAVVETQSRRNRDTTDGSRAYFG